MKPRQGKPVLIILKDGSIHEGHWLKNANYKEKNVRRWRIYKTGKTVPDSDVLAWIDLEGLVQIHTPCGYCESHGAITVEFHGEKFAINLNNDEEES